MSNIQTAIFPQGLALGDNFCNRELEKKRLKANVLSARSTLIMSPRRYGKTSLVLQVLRSAKLPFAHIDLFFELNELEVQNTILKAIGDILLTIESTPKKAFTFVTEFFSDLSVSFSVANSRVSIEFSKSRKSPAKTVLDALKKLDTILEKRQQQVVLFFDEFQRVSQITESETLEGALRHIAQESKNVVFIFSGSNRHLLDSMFSDRAKPLYKLCDRIILGRITAEYYVPFIKDKFKKSLKLSISDSVIDMILELTERHSYYVNLLCHRVCLEGAVPTEDRVEEIWRDYVLEEKSNVSQEMDLLSANQAKMLMAIAKYGETVKPLSGEFITLTKFSLSSASQAIKALEKRDYIAINDGAYTIIDPVIKYIYLFAV